MYDQVNNLSNKVVYIYSNIFIRTTYIRILVYVNKFYFYTTVKYHSVVNHLEVIFFTMETNIFAYFACSVIEIVCIVQHS